MSKLASSSLGPAQRQRVFGPLLIALLVEGLLLAAVGFWLTRHMGPAVQPAFGPIRLDLTKPPTLQPAPTAPPAAAAPAAPERASEAEPTPRPAQPVPDPPPPDVSADAPDEEMAPPSAAEDLSTMPLPNLALLPRDSNGPTGPEQPAPPHANGQMEQISEFIRKANEALRIAGHHLSTVRGIRLTGTVGIAVHYKDGKAWGAWITKSSGLAALDEATLDAASRAVWPPPPPGMEGRELVLPIAGTFN
jgi:outer membrane biosynthesis protein TonB